MWAGHTTYATRFDDGSVLQTMLTLLLMFALAGSAVFVQSGMDEQAASFTRAQFAARVVLALLYLDAHFRVPAARRFTWFLIVGFAVSAVAWGAQEWLAEQWRRPLYLAAIGVEILAPLLAVSRLGHWPANPHHLPERLGLFTIIVLGEAVRGVVVGAVHAEVGAAGLHDRIRPAGRHLVVLFPPARPRRAAPARGRRADPRLPASADDAGGGGDGRRRGGEPDGVRRSRTE